MQLNNLEKLTKARKRIGRGGDRGGTSGRGTKGQKARSGGGVHPAFEGGQMPLSRRLPKRGFTNMRFKQPVCTVNLRDLELRFENGSTIDHAALTDKNLIKGSGRHVVKILGMGTLSKKLVVKANLFSKTAEQAIVKAGGEVHKV